MPIGLIESNGHQNYKNWVILMGYHPRKEGAWVKETNGVYELNDEFYKNIGGIFDPMPHYEEIFKNCLLLQLCFRIDEKH